VAEVDFPFTEVTPEEERKAEVEYYLRLIEINKKRELEEEGIFDSSPFEVHLQRLMVFSNIQKFFDSEVELK
jgi:hypothetical protein